MSTRTLLKLFVVAAALALAPLARAQQTPPAAPAPAPLPDAKTVIAKYVEAIGGADAYKAVSAIHAKGTFDMPAQNLSGQVEMFGARPAKALMRITIGGIGNAESGFNGEVGWTIDPMTGPSVMKGKELDEMKNEAVFDSALHLPSLVKDMTTMGKADFDGKPAYKVKVTFQNGQEQFEYFDVATGLELGFEGSRETQMGSMSVTAYLRDYKKFGGVMQPTTQVQRTMGFDQILKWTEVEFGNVPPTAFDLPAVIKALIR